MSSLAVVAAADTTTTTTTAASEESSSTSTGSIGEGEEISIPNLPSHLRCHSTARSGRVITTRIALSKGSTAFTEVPFAHTIHYSARSSTCETCFAQCDSENGAVLQYQCNNDDEGRCGVHYCSAKCRDDDSVRHRRICHLIRQTNGKNNNAKLMNESLSLLIALSSNSQPLDGVMGMMQDETKKGRRDTAKAEAKFRSLRHGSSSTAMLKHNGAYAAALSVKKLNAIGLYNMHGEEVAFCICPALAMVNHSCLPNCQLVTDDGSCRLRALRDIEPGEELTFSYMSLDGTDIERMDAIKYNWLFACICPRCQGDDCAEFDREHVCYCGSVCYEVDRTQGECCCNGPTA